MINIVIAVVVTLFLTVFCGYYGDANDYPGFLILSCLSGLSCTFLSLFLCFGIFAYNAAQHKANIINREYGKNYTREDIFYADSVIDTIRELDRQRMEINGNILKGGNK